MYAWEGEGGGGEQKGGGGDESGRRITHHTCVPNKQTSMCTCHDIPPPHLTNALGTVRSEGSGNA